MVVALFRVTRHSLLLASSLFTFEVLGQYIYMEANEGRLGDVAELVSPTLVVPQDQGMCLRFWYSMYGDDVESLQVIAQASVF